MSTDRLTEPFGDQLKCVGFRVVPSRKLSSPCYVLICLNKTFCCASENPDNMGIRMKISKTITKFNGNLGFPNLISVLKTLLES